MYWASMQRRVWLLAVSMGTSLMLVASCSSMDDDSIAPSADGTRSRDQQGRTDEPQGSSSDADPACIGALGPADEELASGAFIAVREYEGVIQCQMSAGLLLKEFELKRIDDRTDRVTMEYAHPQGSTSGGPGVHARPVDSAHYPARSEEMPFDGESIAAFSILGVSWTPGGGPDSGVHEPDPTGGPIADVYYYEGTGGAHGLYIGVTSSEARPAARHAVVTLLSA